MKDLLTGADLQRVAGMLTEKFGIRLIVGGSRNSADCVNNTIRLCSLPDNAASERHLMRMFFLIHECGHIVAKSHPTLRREIDEKWGSRAVTILNCLEDVRVETYMTNLLYGCGVKLKDGGKLVTEWVSEMESKKVEEGEDRPLGFDTGLAIYMIGKGLPLMSWIHPKAREVTAKFKDRIVRETASATCTKELLPLALDIFKELPKKEDQDGNQGQDKSVDEKEQPGKGKSEGAGKRDGGDDGANDSTGGAGEGSPPDGDGGDSGDGQDAGGSAEGGGDGRDRDSQGQPEADADKSEEPAEGDGRPQGGDTVSSEGASGDSEGSGGSGGDAAGTGEARQDAGEPTLRPDTKEDTIGDQSFSISDQASEAQQKSNEQLATRATDMPKFPEEDKWLEYKPSPLRDEIEKFRDKAEASIGMARQRLAQILMSEGKFGWRHNLRRGVVDPGRIAALATGVSTRVLRRRMDVPSPDTACALLIDGSGSMGQRANEYSDRRCHCAAVAAAGFASALHMCRHACLVVGFQNGLNRYSVAEDNEGFSRFYGINMAIFKDWRDPPTVWWPRLARSARMYHNGGTPLGGAISLTRNRLEARSERRKVLIAFTDGVSNDNVRAECELAERGGIEVVLIGIQHTAVRDLHRRAVVIQDTDRLGVGTLRALEEALNIGSSR